MSVEEIMWQIFGNSVCVILWCKEVMKISRRKWGLFQLAIIWYLVKSVLHNIYRIWGLKKRRFLSVAKATEHGQSMIKDHQSPYADVSNFEIEVLHIYIQILVY